MGLIRTLKSMFSKNKSTHDGIIKFFDRKKRFGFIISGNNEYFFHATSTKAHDFRALKDGTAVTFQLIQGKKGAQADNVQVQ